MARRRKPADAGCQAELLEALVAFDPAGDFFAAATEESLDRRRWDSGHRPPAGRCGRGKFFCWHLVADLRKAEFGESQVI